MRVNFANACIFFKSILGFFYHFSLGVLFPDLSSYIICSLFESILVVDRKRNHCLPLHFFVELFL